MTFDLHRLLQEYSWGIKQGLGNVTCNTEDLVVIDLVYVFLEVFLTALYFRVTYCPIFRACTPLMQVPYVPECPWEGLGNMRHLREWGTSFGGCSEGLEYRRRTFDSLCILKYFLAFRLMNCY